MTHRRLRSFELYKYEVVSDLSEQHPLGLVLNVHSSCWMVSSPETKTEAAYFGMRKEGLGKEEPGIISSER